MNARGAKTGTIGYAAAVSLLLLSLGACDRLMPERNGADVPDEIVDAAGGEDDAELVRFDEAQVRFSGHEIYDRNCSICHGGDGGGSLGPPLSGNRNLASSVYVVARIQLGGGGMPPFARLLGSEEIASVATFVRQSWENGYGAVSGEQVELQWNGFRRGMRYGTAVPTDF